MAERPSSELLAAYVDGIGELDVEERRRVERVLSDPAMQAEQAATRDLIDQLRALPDETPNVDWAAMERAIHAEVGDEVPRRSFFYRWRFALPAFALAGAAAIVFLVIRAQEDAGGEVSPIAFAPNPLPDHKLPVFERLDDRVTVYLDGTDLEIAETAELDDELADLDLEDLPDVDEASLGFLEPSDLAWIDDLDDDALARAEKALAQPIKLRKGIGAEAPKGSGTRVPREGI